MMKSGKGYTMTEILIVVVIMAVLATLVMPHFFGQKERGVIAEALSKLSAIRQSEEGYMLEHGAYLSVNHALDNWALLGIDDPDNANFTYTVVAAAGPTFDATATRVDTASSEDCPGKTITLTNAGVFGGKHPFGPNPDADAACV